MLLEVESARSLSLLRRLVGRGRARDAPARGGDGEGPGLRRGLGVTSSSLQVHGGIGFTWEHDLHFFLKRAKTDGALFGAAREHRDRVAELERPPRAPRRAVT